MRRFVYSLLILGLISGMIITGIVQATDSEFRESGTFDDFPNMDGNWERASDSSGDLEGDVSRKVYIDIDAGEDVFSCGANFYSYANNPNYSGNYQLWALIEAPGGTDNKHGSDFNGPWWDYESNELRLAGAGNNPQDINLTIAGVRAYGSLIPEQVDQTGSGSNLSPEIIYNDISVWVK